jgi:hypothetical protein
MTSKSVVKPLAKMLEEAVLLIAKFDGEAPHQYVGEGIVDNTKVIGENPRRLVGIGGVELAEVNGEATHQYMLVKA